VEVIEIRGASFVITIALSVGADIAAGGQELKAQATPAPPPAPSATPSPDPPRIKIGGQLRLRMEYRDQLKPDAALSTEDVFGPPGTHLRR
jgi:hypothetical protein